MENDFSGSAQYYDIILGKDNFRKHAQFVSKLLKKYKVKSVLELGCGSGLYLFPLKKLGFKIDGLDISKEMLYLARKQDKKIKLYQEDMSKFKINKKYDSIICLNSSLVLLPNFKLIEKTLRNCYKHLNKNGILLLDLPNHYKEIKESNFSQEKETYKIKNGTLEVIFRDYKKNNKWVSEWFGFVKQKNNFSNFHEYYEELIYSPKELEKSLKNLGFKIIKVFGSRRGGTFDKNKSYRRFYVCQKF